MFHYEVRNVPFGTSAPATESTPVAIADHLAIESGCPKQALQRAERALVLISSRSTNNPLNSQMEGEFETLSGIATNASKNFQTLLNLRSGEMVEGSLH